MLGIKKNDTVVVLAGKDRGKTGKVLRVLTRENRAIVENINIVKKARRRTRQDEQGGIMEIEAPIHLSNLALLDKKTNKPTRFSVSVLKDGSKVRVSKKSGDTL